jgi:hypothetical protein
MRTAAELIAELETEASNFTGVAVAVGFESTTTFVFAHEPGRLEKLEEAMRSGGEPVGLLGYDNQNGGLSVYTRALWEYADQEWVGNYLKELIEILKRLLLASGSTQQPQSLN